MTATASVSRPAPKSTLPGALSRLLRRVAIRQAAVCAGECAAILLTFLPAWWILQAAADRMFHLPWTVRAILLLTCLAGAGWVFHRRVIRPLRHARSHSALALHIERAVPELRSSLISVVEFTSGQPGTQHGSPALIQELVARLEAHAPHLDAGRRAVPLDRLKRWAPRAGAALLVAAAALVVFRPTSGILLQRVFLATTPIPTRTTVLAVTENVLATIGSDLRLAARAEGFLPRSGTLHLTYANGDRANITVGPSPIDASLFEITLRNIQQSFTYRFTLYDGTGATFAATAQTPPVLETIRLVQKFPAYTGLPDETMTPGHLTLRAGSEVMIAGTADEPLRAAAVQLEGIDTSLPLTVGQPSAESLQGRFTVPADGLTGLSFRLTNASGVASQNETIYRVTLRPDTVPTVELLAPAAERLTVLLRSKPQLVFTVTDDFSVRRVVLKYEITRPSLPGIAPVVEAGEEELPLTGPGPQTYRWDLAARRPALTEGCSLTYWLEATDNNDTTGPGIGRTNPRTLTIVSEAEKRAELLEELGKRAAQIEEISETQKKVNQDLDGAIRKSQPTNPTPP